MKQTAQRLALKKARLQKNEGFTLVELSGDTASQIMGTTYSNSTNPGFIGRRASGTAASPGVLNNGDLITFFGGRSYNGTGFTTTTTAYMGIDVLDHLIITKQSYLSFKEKYLI
jgi:hypothetical protein